MPKKKKKRIPKPPKDLHKTPAHVRNDPSLRWVGYRYGEVLYSDTHQTYLRFSRYDHKDPSRVVLASMNGIADLPGTVDEFTVRRDTAQKGGT